MNITERAARDRYAGKVTTTLNNLLLLTMEMALKDERVMGKGNAYGDKRMKRLMYAIMDNYNELLPAFCEKSTDKYHAQWKIERWYRDFYPNDPVCKLQHNEVFSHLFPLAEDIKNYSPDPIEIRSKK